VSLTVLGDLVHGVRTFRRHPFVALLAVVSIGLGVGVATAVFGAADALFLRPLRVREPGRLMEVFTRSESGLREGLSWPEAREVAAEVPSFEGLAVFDRRGATFRNGDELELLLLQAVSDRYFETLGVHAALGRVIGPGADRGLPAPAVVISDRLFRTHFGADPSLVGRPIQLSDRPYTLVGVLPPGFRGLARGLVNDVWISLDSWSRFYGSPESLERRTSRHFEVVARLRPGSSAEQAASELSVLGARWAQTFPEASRGRTLHAERDSDAAGSASPVVLLLLVGALLVVVVASLNASTLLVGLGETRGVEIGIRQALGASPLRIGRQVLLEAGMLAAAGTLLGLVLADQLLRAAPALLPPNEIATDYAFGLDGRALGFASLLAFVAALLGGAVPALRASRKSVAPALRVTPEAAVPRRRATLPAVLVAFQVALAVVTLDASGLLVRSFAATRNARHGFDTERRMLVLQLAMGDETGDLGRWSAALEALRERAGGLPGVRHVSYVRRLPMADYGGGATLPVSVPGKDVPPRGLRYNQVGPAFLETLGVQLREGRFFVPQEHSALAPAVVVVGETLARQLFPGEDAVGKHLLVAGEAYEIVGVVEDTPIERLHEAPEPFFYLPYARRPSSDVALLVETAGEPFDLAAAAKRLVRETSPETNVLAITSLRRQMRQALHDDWLPAVVGTGLAVLGALIALAGLQATVVLVASRRTREFGVRMALGARRRDVLRLVLGQGLAIAVAGAAIGLPGALAAGGLVRGFLRGTSPFDVGVLVLSLAVAAVLGLLASALPAWRAVRTDPARVLRME
jgi:putative ABC transport system permease protein